MAGSTSGGFVSNVGRGGFEAAKAVAVRGGLREGLRRALLGGLLEQRQGNSRREDDSRGGGGGGKL